MKAMAIDEQTVKPAAIDDPDLKPLRDSMGGTSWKRTLAPIYPESPIHLMTQKTGMNRKHNLAGAAGKPGRSTIAEVSIY